jgi:hypothetical protein
MKAAGTLDPVRTTALDQARSYSAELGKAAVAGVADELLREYAARLLGRLAALFVVAVVAGAI